MTRYTSTNPRPIPLDICKENFVVDPESPTGLRWLRSGTGRSADLVAGVLDQGTGYYRVTLLKARYQVHRVVWELVNGPIPKGLILNHKDRNRANNRIGNLELITASGNARHTGKRGDSGWYPVGITQGPTGQVQAAIMLEVNGPWLSICPSFREHNDPTSERLNDMCAKALAAFIERDGPDSPTVASFYSQLPTEAILGPAEGYP